MECRPVSHEGLLLRSDIWTDELINVGDLAHPERLGLLEGSMLKIGYKASAEQFGPRELVEYAVIAENLGFDSVVLSDHFQPWRHTGGHAPYSFSLLSAIGERTKRIELGTSVVTPTFRYHPAIVAQAAATLGCLYPDRIWLGVGTGESMNERPLGIEWPEQKERFARMKEACELMQRLWAEERVTFQGTYYRTHNATIYDRPPHAVPLYIAASGPAAARLAGRIAAGFICTSGKGMGLYSDTLLPAVREGIDKGGRNGADVEMTIEVKISFDSDVDRARRDTRFWAALALPAEDKLGVDDPVEMEALAEALPIDRAASRWVVASEPQELLAGIRPYLSLGFTHLVFHSPGPDQGRFLDLFAREMIPLLRQAGTGDQRPSVRQALAGQPSGAAPGAL